MASVLRILSQTHKKYKNMKLSNYIYNKVGVAAAAFSALALGSCSDADSIPNVSPAYCPSEVTLEIPDDVKPLIYTDNTGSEVLPMVKGEKVTLGYTLLPENASNKEVNWTSSQPNVATIDDGTIEAISGRGIGYSVVTISPVGMYPGSGVSQTLKVKVDETLIQASEFAITSDKEEIYEGETAQLAVDITPENSTYRTVKWSSSDESVATVDDQGVVTAVKVAGTGTTCTVNITASAYDGSGTTTTKQLTIKRVVAPENVTIDQTYSADKGYFCALNELQLILKYTTQPVDCTTSLIEWTSSDPSVATVADGVVTFKGFGETTITAATPDGKSSSIKLNIPAGLLRETFHNENHYSIYNAKQSGNGTSTSHEWHDGYITITTYTQNATNQRADIKWWDTPVTLHAGNYPIIAIKVDDVKDLGEGITSRNLNFDVVGKSESGKDFKALGNGNNKYSSDYKCSDGSHVFVYDLTKVSFGTGGIAPTNESITFSTFQLKYADMKTVNHQVKYNLYWFQTFKSIADVEAYIEHERLTFEKK